MTEIGSNRLVMLAAEVRNAHAGVESAAVARATRALEAGRALIEAKSLLKHGRWLPWLKDNCGLPERTAQLYMKLAALDQPPELIAALGMERASTEDPQWRAYLSRIAVAERRDHLPDYSEPVQREWLLFALFVRSYDHAEWCMRHGYASPDEWLADDAQRRSWRMPSIPEVCKASWAEHLQRHADTPRARIEAMLTA